MARQHISRIHQLLKLVIGWGFPYACLNTVHFLGFTICGILIHENKLRLSFSILFKQDESSPIRDDYLNFFSFQKAFTMVYYEYSCVKVIFKNWYIWNFSFKDNFLFGNTKLMDSSGSFLHHNLRKIRYSK